MTMIILAAVGLILLLTAAARAAYTEYLDLTVGGDEMAPAMCNGDTAHVKICTDASLIKTGSQTSANPGDIIVYCAGAVTSVPQSMWTCGRAISKHLEGDTWYIKTKMDNVPEPDPWEVPGYALLGVVVQVTRNGDASNKPSTPETNTQNQQQTPQTNPTPEPPSIPSVIADFSLGIAIGVILGLTTKKTLSKHTSSTPVFHSTRTLEPT